MLRRALAFILLMSSFCFASTARAEFIGNAFGGQAEESSRVAASLAFQGLEMFYASMSLLERRARNDARAGFSKSVTLMNAAQAEYMKAATLLDKKAFNFERIGPQSAALITFLEPFGARREGATDAQILEAYSKSFLQTAKLIAEGSNEMSLSKFREIQTFIQRQISIGIIISQAMGR
jgi:hypothetical protein